MPGYVGKGGGSEKAITGKHILFFCASNSSVVDAKYARLLPAPVTEILPHIWSNRQRLTLPTAIELVNQAKSRGCLQ